MPVSRGMPHETLPVEITDGDRATLRRAITAMGEVALADRLCISRLTLGRCLAGLPLRTGTALLIHMGAQELAQVEGFIKRAG